MKIKCEDVVNVTCCNTCNTLENNFRI